MAKIRTASVASLVRTSPVKGSSLGKIGEALLAASQGK